MKKFALVFIFSLIFFTGCAKDSQVDTSEISIGTEALSSFDGHDGEKCYVAVSGIIYEIKNSSSWIDGEHLDSKGKASCGKDLTEAIKDSPHGVSILTSSPKVKRIGKLLS